MINKIFLRGDTDPKTVVTEVKKQTGETITVEFDPTETVLLGCVYKITSPISENVRKALGNIGYSISETNN